MQFILLKKSIKNSEIIKSEENLSSFIKEKNNNITTKNNINLNVNLLNNSLSYFSTKSMIRNYYKKNNSNNFSLNFLSKENFINKEKNNDISNNKNKNIILEKNKKEENKTITNYLNIKDYKIINNIGNGSYGNIYLVKEIKNGNKLAIKKIICDGEEGIIKFKNQINILQNLNILSKNNQYNILPIYKYNIKKLDSTIYSIYYSLPLAKCDWDKIIENKNIIQNENNLFKILYNLSKAFSYMQKNKIVHRDIKPKNILIMNNNDYYICDYDEMIYVKNDYDYYEIRGTELFMCPLLSNSIINGKRKIKFNIFKSDVYSLGLCFVYAITKKY